MAKSVQHFERSDGLDTALYKNYLFSFLFMYGYLTIMKTNTHHTISFTNRRFSVEFRENIENKQFTDNQP